MAEEALCNAILFICSAGFNGSHKVLNVASAFYSRHVSTKVAILSKTIAHGLKGQNASYLSCSH